MIYSPELIKSLAPAIFATSPSQKMSNKYTFVPTEQVLEFFEREGWEISSVRQTGNGNHSLHEIKFRNGQLPKVGDTLVEAIIKNSHNGTSAFTMGAGLHRLVCSNGLTVPTAVSENFRMRHNQFQLDDVKELAEQFSKKLPVIEQSVGRMMSREMTFDEKIDFVRKSSKIRFNDDRKFTDLEIIDILEPNRSEDEGDDLWRVFNVVQEKYIRGGVRVSNNKGKTPKMRKIDSIIVQNKINTQLWELAEEIL
jgi:hypothetical protein